MISASRSCTADSRSWCRYGEVGFGEAIVDGFAWTADDAGESAILGEDEGCYDRELLTVACEFDRVLFSDMPVDRLSSNRCSIFPLDDAFEGRTRKRSYFTPGHQHCAVGKVRGTIEVMHASL